jgi:hypothetical protein
MATAKTPTQKCTIDQYKSQHHWIGPLLNWQVKMAIAKRAAAKMATVQTAMAKGPLVKTTTLFY